MRGWFADLFRLAWGLIYWNVRKSWFRLRRGRAPCPCQSPSDSGKAFETGCEAAATWDRQSRFRRVCPLLVKTPDGLRCSANTPDVRPFWGVAARYYGGAALCLYAVGALGVFIFLRSIGYPVSIVHIGLPPLWHKVGEARGWYFVERANRSFAEGRTAEGLLYLASAYEFDPRNNYEAGLTLAKVSQAGQPARSDEFFQRLLRDHPDKRSATSQDWFRALLARGDFDRIARLAGEQVLADREHAAVWVRALFFAVRQLKDPAPLVALLTNSAPEAVMWHPIARIEQMLLSGQTAEARAALEQPWPKDAPAFSLFYQANSLIESGSVLAATDLLARHRGVLDREAEVTLLLDAFAQHGAKGNLRRLTDELLAGRLDASRIKILCAHLIRYPDTATFAQLWDKFEAADLPVNNDTVGSWFSMLATAGALGDYDRLHRVTGRLKESSGTPFVALNFVEAFFRGQTADRRLTAFLPLLPLPLEVTYALLERYVPVAAGTPRA